MGTSRAATCCSRRQQQQQRDSTRLHRQGAWGSSTDVADAAVKWRFGRRLEWLSFRGTCCLWFPGRGGGAGLAVIARKAQAACERL